MCVYVCIYKKKTHVDTCTKKVSRYFLRMYGMVVVAAPEIAQTPNSWLQTPDSKEMLQKRPIWKQKMDRRKRHL